jgi:hypothetical protein
MVLMGGGVEPRESVVKGQAHLAQRAVALFSDDEMGDSALLELMAIAAVDEQGHVCVLPSCIRRNKIIGLHAFC